MKTCLPGYILLLLLSFQLLTVKEWGKILYSNTIQEEILEPIKCSEEINESSEDVWPFINSIRFFALNKNTENTSKRKPHPYVTRLYANLSFDIPTPPPLFSV